VKILVIYAVDIVFNFSPGLSVICSARKILSVLFFSPLYLFLLSLFPFLKIKNFDAALFKIFAFASSLIN